jgi:simple sugar transport system permease protein
MESSTSPKPAASPSASSPSGPAKRRTGGAPGAKMGPLKRFLTLREGSIVVVTLIAFLYFAISTPNFVSADSFKTLLPYFAPVAILALGEVFVMTLGEIDLSIGALYLFTPFLFWKLNTSAHIPLVLAVIAAIIVAALLGAVNGYLTAVIGIPSFVATLGMLFLLDGVTLIISHSEQITTPGTSVVNTTTFASIFGAGTYSEIIWAVGLVIILQVLLSFTRWGLYTVSVGSNKIGSAEAGINVKLVIIRNFMLSATFAGFAGILEAVRTSALSPDPSGSNTLLLSGVAAVIIGGTLMTGGAGTVVGMLIGALFLGILNEGLVIKGVNANYQDLYLGVAILVAMLVNVYISRVRKGSGRG